MKQSTGSKLALAAALLALNLIVRVASAGEYQSQPVGTPEPINQVRQVIIIGDSIMQGSFDHRTEQQKRDMGLYCPAIALPHGLNVAMTTELKGAAVPLPGIYEVQYAVKAVSRTTGAASVYTVHCVISEVGTIHAGLNRAAVLSQVY